MTGFLLFSVVAWGRVVGGKLDLRGADVSRPVELNGYWEFYWKQLLSPDQIPGIKSYIQYPSIWNGAIHERDTLTGAGFGTYHMTILTDPIPRDYALWIDDVYCSYKLYVNGQVVAVNGVVSDTRETYRPEWRPQVINLPMMSGEIDLVLQIANFDHSKGGPNDPIKFGLSDYITRTSRYQNNLSIITTIVLKVH